ncbi:MAG: hypothetical protein MI866_16155 [Bacteroidales bacterium]|nr:hypothetical protein [Bacteroidales bacterium]
MRDNPKHTGFAIALAWPETYCKQPGSWYDSLTLLTGANHNNYYKVGHAALVLISTNDAQIHYFDFGRYHTPYQYGRVRSAETDHDLQVKTMPVISSDKTRIENYQEILVELQKNPACHGEGELHAAYCSINFEKAYNKALHMQEFSPMPYGPFQQKGSNCSRFVNTVIRAGKPNFKHRFNLNYKVPLTPTPINNVQSLEWRVKLPKLQKGKPFSPVVPLGKLELISTLPAPERHHSIPANAQWLSGEGAGSWFVIHPEEDRIKVSRYSPKGVVECQGSYENEQALELLQKEKAYTIEYPSNCMVVTLKIGQSIFVIKRAV